AAGIDGFYSHQAEAIDLLRARRHTVVATGTASGKSLCYHVPLLEAALDGGTGLYLAPTRALGADQLRQVRRYPLDVLVADTYDSDTPTHVRASIRSHATFVLTNPDMLHIGILPNHHRWARFMRRLRFVVVDEAHTLRGIFGSHVALVLRRLRRLAARYGSDPVFALASATIGNPADHASELVGAEVVAVTDDGAPSGERTTVFWNPPWTPDQRRRSSNSETASLMEALVRQQARTLTFSKSRVASELVARYTQDRLDPEMAARIAAYRAGYLASERRVIEQGLSDGALLGVSATNALELGIDIGDLDAVLLNGFPGTVASARQQSGRAGRTGQASLAVLVPADDPLDQFYVSHPEEFFGRPHEAALVNPSNPHILRPHLGCAAYEHPLTEADHELFGPRTAEVTKEMLADGDLRERRDRLWWASTRPPAPDVNIRSAGGSPYRIVEAGTGRLIGSSDASRAHQELHPGAIYLHQGETFRVTDLILDDRVALVAQHARNEYTQAKVDHDLLVLSVDGQGRVGPGGLYSGLVRVTDRVTGYQRKRLPEGTVIEQHDLELPPQTLVTRAVWYTIDEQLLNDALEPLGLDMELVL
ncbi:MAG TPA: DEAD/DEAH box helicase, partial [Nitriliruptorales bacterium]